MLLAEEFIVSFLFLVNKVYVYGGRRSGWSIGAIGCLLSIGYFYQVRLFVFLALNFSLMVLMAYGYFKGRKPNPRVERIIQGVSVAAMVALAIFAFNGALTVFELVSSLLFVVGTYLLTADRDRAGWITYFAAHLLSAVVGFGKVQNVYAGFQIASAVVAWLGAKNGNRRGR